MLAMVSCPLAPPAAVGSNCTFSVVDWPGLSDTGRPAPTTENPLPVALAPLMERAAVPVDFKVMDWEAGEFNATLPNVRLLVLQLMVGTAGVRLRLKVFETWLALAAINTEVAELTELTVAVNCALVALAGTVTLAGTLTAELLLVRPTVTPAPGAALPRETVHVSVPAPTIED